MIEALTWPVPGDGGQPLEIRAWRLSGGDGPRVYLQAGVHADEIAGMLVLHRLLPQLAAAHDRGVLRGTVTVVPQANPLGLAQFRQGRLLGRFHETTHRNFNRHFHESAALRSPATTFAAWQRTMLAAACNADIVLDLHTDSEALPYLYLHRDLWPAGRDLAAALGADVAILWDEDDDGAFEGAVAAHWARDGGLRGRLVATVELRGQSDVSDALAGCDADGMLAFLRGRGVIAESPGVRDWHGEAVPIAHMETVLAPVSGVLVYERELGATVEAGERVARIVAHPGVPSSEYVLVAPQAGRIVTRNRERLVAQGDVALKLTGSRPSAGWSGGALDP
ncbi:succinylglutamate desuccinylase [Burkholderia paludis]|uniref:succinylglutamate desuccinylase/aspartoacylase domain-containing protein n=1 Tax=Burkholderia paludis TaxID=1506587 RepID=UPI0004DB6ECF|nr:succinylglutamate desuccinylase/aspartoacylase family protein [Burkholderia paludis]KFG94478.1 succinylglutamate desuccinylase [Burkholderia paludis]